MLEVGKCIYDCGTGNASSDNLGITFPLPSKLTELDMEMCSEFSRMGTLCGACKDGYYPLAYSFDMKCVECPNGKSNWWKYVLVAYFPLTIFYFVNLLQRKRYLFSPYWVC